jgi:RNA polymerase sigma-70 factor, ECF subfamily
MATDSDNHQLYESFTRAFLRHERKVRGFVRTMMTSDTAVDDIIQEVATVAWRKFADLKEEEDFGLWACVIARFEVMKWRRSLARDRLVFSEHTLELLAADELENVDKRERERSALAGCMQKLSEAERTLVMAVHTPGASVRRIAEETSQSARRLYRRVSGLRLALLSCVKRQLAKGA